MSVVNRICQTLTIMGGMVFWAGLSYLTTSWLILGRMPLCGW